jgi:glyceraldehyde-3-phosphate dehydrogenase/erythrose-4-phosphate dehydrogenase
MRVLVAGVGRIGAKILLQLKKNPSIEVLTVDPRIEPYAVQEGIISSVDFREALTPIALEHVIEQVKPDLVLVTTTTEDMDLGKAPGIEIFVEALKEELAAVSNVPVIAVARTNR